MIRDSRLAAIQQHLYSHGLSSVQTIARAVDASPATVRRDLLALEAAGIVARTHGGAQIAVGAGVEVAFGLREKENLSAKRAIADAAFELIRPNSAVFLDAGTTVLQLARRLRLDPMPLSLFTNGLVIAQAVMDAPGLEVTVIGGQLRSENASMIGVAAEAMLDRFWFDQLFLGASAVADDGRLYGLSESEARLNGRMMARSSHTLLLVDASKFGRRATHLVAPITPAMTVLTDASLPASWRRRLAEIGTYPTVANVPAVSHGRIGVDSQHS